MKRLVSTALWCLVLGYLLAVVLSGMMQAVGTFDEPLPWVSAVQIRRGLVPHVDFWTTYPPLTYWLTAGAFSLLGETAIAARLLSAVFFLLLLTGVAILARRDFYPASWATPSAVLLAALGAGPLFVYAFGLALSASLCALISYFIFCRDRPALTLIPGLILAGSLLMRINFGVYAAAAMLLDLALVKEKKRGGFIVGPMLVALLLYLLPYHGKIGEVIEQIVKAPSQVLAKTRFIPLPAVPLYYAAIAFPLVWFSLRMLAVRPLKPVVLAPLGAAAAICTAAYLCRSNSAVLPAIALLSIIGVVLFDRYLFHLHRSERGLVFLYALFVHYFLWRADEWHLRPLLALIGLLLPFLLFVWIVELAPMPACLLALVFLSVVAGEFWRLHSFRPDRASILSALALIGDGEFIDGTPDSVRFLGVGAATLRSEWLRLYPDLPELSALRFVYARSRENDCVYVGVPEHAAVFVGDVRAYWLLDRCLAVKRFILEPGVTTTEAAETEMARDLQRNRVRWVVLTPPEKGDDGFRRNRVPGSNVLDSAIASHYRIAATFGSYVVLNTADF